MQWFEDSKIERICKRVSKLNFFQTQYRKMAESNSLMKVLNEIQCTDVNMKQQQKIPSETARYLIQTSPSN